MPRPTKQGFVRFEDKLFLLALEKFDWEEILGGDSSVLIARSDGETIQMVEIQYIREYVGDEEALDIGYPFWSREVEYPFEELDPRRSEVESAMSYVGLDADTFAELSPVSRTLRIAEGLMQYGTGVSESSSGWARDVVPVGRIKRHTPGRPEHWQRNLVDEEEEFRRLLQERDEES